MKLTPWFDGKVKPVREGWYECRDPDFKTATQFDYWNGKKWCEEVGYSPYSIITQDEMEWRGILK